MSTLYEVSLTIGDIDADTPEEAARLFWAGVRELGERLSVKVTDEKDRYRMVAGEVMGSS